MVMDGASGAENDLLTAFYEEKQGRAIGTEDVEHLVKLGRAQQKSETEVKIAQMQLLAAVISGRKIKREDQQLDFFVGPLVGMLNEANKPGTDPALLAAANSVRQDPSIKSVMVKLKSRALYETADVMMNYYERFGKLKAWLQNNKDAILAANPHLTEEMYQKTLSSVTNLSAIYEQKKALLENPLFIKLRNNQLFFTPSPTGSNRAAAESPLTDAEYKQAIDLLGNVTSFEDKDVEPLVDAMSLYQSLLAADVLQKDPKENQFGMASFSELFQAAMRHPMVLEETMSSAKKVKATTPQGEVVDDATLNQGLMRLANTKNAVMKANYGFGDNFMLDGASVNDFLILRDASEKANQAQKALVNRIADAMKAFSVANNQCYLNPTPENLAEFKRAFENLQIINKELEKRDIQDLLRSLDDNNAVLGQVYPKIKKTPLEVVEKAINAVSEGALLYVRKYAFDDYRGQQISKLLLNQSKYNRFQNDGELKKLGDNFKTLIKELYGANPQTDGEKRDFFKKVTNAKELIAAMEQRIKDIEKERVEQGLPKDDILIPVDNPVPVVEEPIYQALPIFAPDEPKPGDDTFGNIKVAFKVADKGERRAIKSKLRDPQDLLKAAQFPANYSIVETKKTKGIKTSFVVKNQDGENVLYVKVKRNQIRIRELIDNGLTDNQRLQVMHHLTQGLKSKDVQATVISKDINKLKGINEISVNAGHATYLQGTDEKKALHKEIETDSINKTIGMVIPEISIQCKGNNNIQLRDKFETVIKQGLFVPRLISDGNMQVPILNGDVTIATEIPLLALKQYESALNAGLTPIFAADARKKVENFVKKQLDASIHDRQIHIHVPVGSLVSGAQLLERVKRASQDGFVVNLGAQAQNNLRQYMANLKANDPSLQYDLPLRHSHAAALVNNMLGIGLLPNTQALAGKMDVLRAVMREDAVLNNLPIAINSGNIARDFEALKFSYENLGRIAKVDDANLKALRNYAGSDPKANVPVIDLRNISAKEQISCAHRMAQLGIYCNITTTVNQDSSMFIRSKNKEHARVMFERYLNQGFTPHIYDRRVKELSESGASVTIEGKDPKVIFERMKCCAKEGLKILLSDEQKQIMRKFSEKESPQLPIHGHGWAVVKHNIELANQLGMQLQNVSDAAKAAYLREQAVAKQSNADMPRIGIVPIQSTQSRFLRSDIKVDNKEKTKQFAASLFKEGINISMSGLSVLQANLETESKKTKWFGWSKTPTKEALQAKQFLEVDWRYMTNQISTLAKEYLQSTEDSLNARAKVYAPPEVPVSKAKPVHPTTTIKRSNTLDNVQPPRQAFTPSVAASGQSAAPVAEAPSSQPVTIESVLARFKQIRDQAQADLDTKARYNMPGRVFDNARRICNAIEQVVKKAPDDQQMAQLQQLLTQVAKGDFQSLNVEFGARPHYVVDIKVKEVAKDLADRLVPAPKQGRRLGY